MYKHLILYDGTCPFCYRSALLVALRDKKGIFAFTSLEGKTARGMFSKERIIELEQKKSVILLENVLTPTEKMHTEGKALFRILWLLPLPYPLFGVLYFFPGFLYNPWYRFFAKHRQGIDLSSCSVPGRLKERFLP